MAIGMKHWFGLVIGGSLIVAVWALPPSPLELPQRRERPPEVVRAEAMTRDVSVSNAVLQRLRWSDSLSALALRTAREGVAVGAPTEEGGVTPAGVAEWRRGLIAYAATLEPRADGILIGSFLQPRDLGAVADLPVHTIFREQLFVGVRDGTPYCLEVDMLAAGATDVDVIGRGDAGFGSCRLYARFGMAGPHVQSWLEAGALTYGSRAADDRFRYARTRSFYPWERNAELFGLRRLIGGTASLEVERCLSGQRESCVRAVLERPLRYDEAQAEILGRSPLTYVAPLSQWDSPFRSYDDYLFADLEAEFGAEAFSRFWTSDAEVPDAFEEAFGVEMADWLAGWVEENIGTYQAGPHIRAGDLLLGLLTLVALCGTAVGTAVRRRVA